MADEQAAVSFFYRSIPFNFYGIFAVSMTLLFALELLPWTDRKMADAMERVRRTGRLDAPGASPLTASELTELRKPEDYASSPVDFVVPISTLIGFALGSYFVTGSVLIAEAFGLAVLTAALLAWMRGLEMGRVIEGFVEGCKGVTAGAILLGLAVTLSRVSEELGTAGYIVEAVSAWMVPLLFPALILAICMVVSFSIGTSFGTFAVIFPLVLPLAWSMDHVGPMTRTAADAALLLGAMAGYDPADPSTSVLPVPDYRVALTGDVKGLRVGLLRGFFLDGRYPHATAVIGDASGVKWAVDSWYEPAGGAPDIMPLREWRSRGGARGR